MSREKALELRSWAIAARTLASVGALASWTFLAVAQTLPYTVVDTGQSLCYDAAQVIPCPQSGQPFFGQDAQVSGHQPSYALSSDGLTVVDQNTGLTWEQSPETNGDGVLNSSDKLTWTQAQARPAALNAIGYGGFSDWRLPAIKELYSLMDFQGTDPGPGNDPSTLTPFIDRAYFNFAYGDTAAGERIIDAQYASSTLYVSTTMLGDATLFGVNFADGRIKGYGLTRSGMGDMTFFVRCVRGAAYGVNDFADNGDSTITDRASGLMWSKGDSARGLNWQEALAWIQTKNAENLLGHNDWRLPNAKELQSIVDYTRSPDTTSSAAIAPLFTCTGITSEAGQADYPFYWTGTTHMSSTGVDANAIYIAFGRAMGYMTDPSDPAVGAWLDVHGAGAQRSDPKEGDPADYPRGRGPQGDAIRIYNYVRLVRDAPGAAALAASFTFSPGNPTDATAVTFTASASGGTPPYIYGWDFCGTSASGESVTVKLPAGNCSVTLTVTDSSETTATASKSVAVGYSVAIASVSSSANPVRLMVAGSGFESGCTVLIGGAAVPKTQFKSGDLVVTKGSGLKAMVPKGVPVQVTVRDPDGRESAPYSYTR